jgi:hypothetical protein
MAHFDSRVSPREVDCLAKLQQFAVRFLVVGGQAVRVHGHVRPSKDLDVLVGNDQANAENLCAALSAMGIRHPNLQPGNIAGLKRQINFFDWGFNFEIITAADGVDFDSAYGRRQYVAVSGLDIPLMGRDDLVEMKRRSTRVQDIEDARALGAV